MIGQLEMLNSADAMALSMACLTLGVLIGLIGGLKIAAVLSAGFRQRLDELERRTGS